MKKDDSINIALGYFLLKTTGKKFAKKKLYLNFLTDFGSETLVMLSIKILSKLSDITYWVEFGKAW